MRHGKVCDNGIAIKPSILKQGNGANAELAAPAPLSTTQPTQRSRGVSYAAHNNAVMVSTCFHMAHYSTQLNSTENYGRRCLTPLSPHRNYILS